MLGFERGTKEQILSVKEMLTLAAPTTNCFEGHRVSDEPTLPSPPPPHPLFPHHCLTNQCCRTHVNFGNSHSSQPLGSRATVSVCLSVCLSVCSCVRQSVDQQTTCSIRSSGELGMDSSISELTNIKLYTQSLSRTRVDFLVYLLRVSSCGPPYI